MLGSRFHRDIQRWNERPRRENDSTTNKKFHLEFCTVAHWKDGKIIEERLFYDQVGMLKQIVPIQ
jgi:ketosteroid isomerase-like protein